MKKKIALSCDIDEENRIRLLQFYNNAISNAGAVPVIMPPITNRHDIDEWIETVGIDAIVLTGGADIQPKEFGQNPIPELGRVSAQRDEYELALLDSAIRHNLPVLGICRGLQTINVYFGGTLIQDMATQLGAIFAYHDQTLPTTEPVHTVNFSENSKISSLFECLELPTNSHHHQCVDKLGKGLIAVGHTSDGIIEAIESEYPNIVAVQFHPERMTKTNAKMRVFFENWIRSLSQKR